MDSNDDIDDDEKIDSDGDYSGGLPAAGIVPSSIPASQMQSNQDPNDVFQAEGIVPAAAPKKQLNSNNDPNDVFQAEGIAPPGVPVQQLNPLQQLGALAGRFNDIFQQPLGALGAGVLSGAEHIPVNLANLPHDLISNLFPQFSVPSRIDPLNYINNNSGINNIFSGIGQGISNVVGGGLGYRALEGLTGVSAATPLLQRALLGGASEAGISSSDQPGGRTLAGTIGAIPPLLNGIRPSVIGQRIADIAENNRNTTSNLYNSVLDSINDASDAPISYPDSMAMRILPGGKLGYGGDTLSDVLQNTSRKEAKPLSDFLQDPTFQNAHDAQSALGGIYRGFKSNYSQLLPEQKNAMTSAASLQGDLQDAMGNYLNNIGRSDLGDAYKNAAAQYKNTVVPFSNKPVTQFNNQEIGPDTLAQKLASSYKFNQGPASSTVPGFSTYQFLNSISKSPFAKYGELGLAAFLGHRYGGGE